MSNRTTGLTSDLPVLRAHRLNHVAELRVGRTLLTTKFASGCSVSACNATCCQGGVAADIAERDAILAHSELIVRHMEPYQVRDPKAWFETEALPDADYPSGLAVDTRTTDDGCVFLDRSGLCVLQKAATAEALPKFHLKPFFCVAFPITIDGGALETDEPDFTERPHCCSVVESGTLSPIEVCREELEFMLGSEGFQELRRIALERTPQGSP